MYDPTIGRWTSEDPSGFAGADSNLYRYANNAPTTHADPSGQVLVARTRDVAEGIKRLLNTHGAGVEFFEGEGGGFVLYYTREQAVKDALARYRRDNPRPDPFVEMLYEELVRPAGGTTVFLKDRSTVDSACMSVDSRDRLRRSHLIAEEFRPRLNELNRLNEQGRLTDEQRVEKMQLERKIDRLYYLPENGLRVPPPQEDPIVWIASIGAIGIKAATARSNAPRPLSRPANYTRMQDSRSAP